MKSKLLPQTLSDRAYAVLKSAALIHNFKAISKLVPNQKILPMIKANGYGHDAIWVARQLQNQARLEGFGVATFPEGAQIRESLSPSASKKIRILVFAGSPHWTPEKASFCAKHELCPVISTWQDWKLFYKKSDFKKIQYEIKFNTGMNRLGLTPDLLPDLLHDLKKIKPQHWPKGILSHLAMSDEPHHPLSLKQKLTFKHIRQSVLRSLPCAHDYIHFHFGNSGAIWNAQEWEINSLTQIVRPGIALYGISPSPGAPLYGLKRVMSVYAEIMGLQKLKAGESTGYDALYKVPRTASKGVLVGILSLGYADGFHRALSNTGFVWFKGAKRRILGAVSMDMAAIECPTTAHIGDQVELIGEHLEPWAQAQAAHTVPYELLTSVSDRVERRYG